MNSRYLHTLIHRSMPILASKAIIKPWFLGYRPWVLQFSSNVTPTETDHVQHRKKSKIPFLNWFYEDIFRGRVKINSFYLYAGITKQINYLEFFRIIPMDDTFNSWFLITELHVWMLIARLRNDGKDGKIASQSLVTALWDDTAVRAKVLSPGDSSTSKKQIIELAQEFKASLLIYDEGLLSTDTVLASALWLRFCSKSCEDPRVLELLTAYVRDQMFHLENTPKQDLIHKINFNWKPLPTSMIETKT